MRGVLGEPDRLDYVSLREDLRHRASAASAISRSRCTGSTFRASRATRWSSRSMRRTRRVTLSFPSPFLRSEPAVLIIEGGETGSARSWRTEEIVSYESGFKRELVAFHESVVDRLRAPVTSGRDGLRDIALCEAIIECHRRQAPVDDADQRSASEGRPDDATASRTEHGNQAAGTGVIASPTRRSATARSRSRWATTRTCRTGSSVLDQVAAAGYAGIDLGPVGYLGTRRAPRGTAGRARAWAWPAPTSSCPMPITRRCAQALPDLDELLTRSTPCRRTCPGPPPRPTLADAGSRDRRQPRPGGPPGSTRWDWTATAGGGSPTGLARVVGALPRPRLRADLPPGDRNLRRGALGDRGGARAGPTSGSAWRPGT